MPEHNTRLAGCSKKCPNLLNGTPCILGLGDSKERNIKLIKALWRTKRQKVFSKTRDK